MDWFSICGTCSYINVRLHDCALFSGYTNMCRWRVINGESHLASMVCDGRDSVVYDIVCVCIASFPAFRVVPIILNCVENTESYVCMQYVWCMCSLMLLCVCGNCVIYLYPLSLTWLSV